jgi:hypothetical protein
MTVEKGTNPKEDKSGLGCGKEVECSLTRPVDGSGVRHGKVHWCGGGQGRAEQHCTIIEYITTPALC